MKTELKNLYFCSQSIALNKGTILQKRGDISKFKRALVLKRTFPETKCECVLTYQTSSF